MEEEEEEEDEEVEEDGSRMVSPFWSSLAVVRPPGGRKRTTQ